MGNTSAARRVRIHASESRGSNAIASGKSCMLAQVADRISYEL